MNWDYMQTDDSLFTLVALFNAKNQCTVKCPLPCTQKSVKEAERSEDQTSLHADWRLANEMKVNVRSEGGFPPAEDVVKVKSDDDDDAVKKSVMDRTLGDKTPTRGSLLRNVSLQEGPNVFRASETGRAKPNKTLSQGPLHTPLSKDPLHPLKNKDKCDQGGKKTKSNSEPYDTEQTIHNISLPKSDVGRCRCAIDCQLNIDQSDQKRLLENFTNMDSDAKNAYLAKCMVNVSDSNVSSRNTYGYKVKLMNGKTVNVCRKRFVAMHMLDDAKGRRKLARIVRKMK